MKKPLRQPPPFAEQLALPLDFIPVPASAAGAPGHGVPGDGAPGGDAPPRPRPPLPGPSVPPPSSPPQRLRRILLQEHLLEYALRRSKRRSIGFVIDDDGLRVTAPRWVTLGDIEDAIREKQRWILAKLAERHERRKHRLQPQMQWRDGAALPYLGGGLTLRIRPGQPEGVRHDPVQGELIVCLPADAGLQQLKDRVLGWLQAEAKALFAQRLPLYAQKLGVTYRSFTLSSATTQWGSCSADGRIRLNWRLMHFALEQIDYVIAHELSHLREMNHSPPFWATVQSVFPEFAAARKVLRERGPEIMPMF
ncbi:MAG: M48 family metallopeptidase [Noviherbaspirillum sp.]